MRVLTVGNMFPPHHLGGYELMWRSSVAHLRGAGHTVRVLTTGFRADEPDPDIPEDPDAHRELDWYWRDHDFPPLHATERLRIERTNARVLQRHLSDFRPDVVAWWPMGGMSLSLMEQVRRAELPSVAVVCDDWLLYGPDVDAWTRMWSRRPNWSAVAELVTGLPARPRPLAPDHVIFLSVDLRDRALSRGLELPHAEVVPDGADLELFRPVPPKPWEWRLLHLGRVDERKGIALAVEALAHLPDEATLRVVGAGDEQHLLKLAELARELGVDGRLALDGRVPRDEAPAAYAEADALLFPVLWQEPWGLVPLEAMATGTPVIASGRGGSGEYLRDGENCLLFDGSRGAPALADAVRRLAGDEELRARLREGGLATAGEIDHAAFDRAIAAALERVAA